MPQLEEPTSSTSASLLERVRQRDAEAWRRFAALYSPLVYGWARRAGLQESDAADAVQDVFQAVFARLGDFQNDGRKSSFRGWLWAIARNRIRLHYRRLSHQARGTGGAEAAQQMNQIPAMLESEEEPTDDAGRRALLRRGLQLIKDDFSDSTWQAFWQQALQGREAGDVARELGLTPAAVRQARYRVLCRLREELAGL